MYYLVWESQICLIKEILLEINIVLSMKRQGNKIISDLYILKIKKNKDPKI